MKNVFCCCLLLLLFASFRGYSQREIVHLDLDKYSCKAGDTVYFKGYIFQGPYPSAVSTNLYVELFTGKGILVQRNLFPIIRGQSIGQLIIPDSIPTNNYYVVALTKQQLNYDTVHFFSVPLLVYNKDKPNVIHHKKLYPEPGYVTASWIKGVYWITRFSQGELYSMLEIDSGAGNRKLQIVKPIKGDSILAGEVTVNSDHPSKYAIFPVDTTKEIETLLLYEDSTLIGRQVLHLRDKPKDLKLNPDTLDISPNGYNSWELKMPDSVNYFTSISVTDADRSITSPVTIEQLNDTRTDNLTITNKLVDTSYITFTGNASKENYLFGKKKLKDPFAQDIVMTGVRDSNYIFIRTVHMNEEGNFTLDSLFFFDNLSLQFQINKEEDGSTKNIKLALAKFIPPGVDSTTLTANWEDDTVPIGQKDTTFAKSELTKYELSKVKTLKTAVVKGWKNPRNELDDRYTTGPFSEPAMEVYDLRNDSSDYNRDVFWFLNAMGGRLSYNPVSDALEDEAFHHPIHYFVDEVEYHDAGSIRMFDFDRIAYIKVLESDFLSTERPSFNLTAVGGGPLKIGDQKTAINVCIYTRKGTDFRTMRGGLNKIPVKGYSKILKFNPDYVTLYWDALGGGNDLRIRFTNNETAKRFRVKVEGMSYTGKVIHYETVLGD